jgi:hypothetical protein
VLASGLIAGCDATSATPIGIPVRIDAPAQIAPGTSVQLTARYARGGSSQDVTATAKWHSSNPEVLQVSDTGLVRGLVPGEAGIFATYADRTAATGIFVLPPGTFRHHGEVREIGGGPRGGLAGVAVTVISGSSAGLMTTTDPSGKYALYGVLGPLSLEFATPGFPTSTCEVSATRHTELSVRLNALAASGTLCFDR